jgi:dTDP-glucose 4,6-dehydratase
MKKVFVIGANSFSGQDFVRHVVDSKKYAVYGIYRTNKDKCMIGYDLSPLRLAELNLAKEPELLLGMLDAVQPDYIVNFAAQSEVAPSWATPEDWYEMNTCFVARLANYLREKSWLSKYVHISTPEMYGHCDGIIYEDQPYNPSTPYAASKMAGDICLRMYYEQFGIPVVFVRSANVCGPRQQLHKIIPRSALFVLNNLKVPLHGGGTSVRGFTDIRDVSRAEELLMQVGRPGDIYHVSNSEFPTIKEVVQTVCEELNAKLASMNLKTYDCNQITENVPQRRGNDTAYKLNCDKIKQLGWGPNISIRESIRDTVSWIMENWKVIRDMPVHYEHKR